MVKGDQTDQIKKFIQVLINMVGVEDATEQSEVFYKTHHDGMDQSKRDAEDASPKIEEFLKRWKYELMLVGGAVAGIYALVRYSSVAHTMTDILARSFGYLADVILITLLPVVMVLAGWIIAVAKAFQELPDWLKNVIGWSIGTVIALEAISYALKILGATAGVTALLLAGLAGLLIGVAVVLLLRDLGFWKALSETVGNATAAFRNWVDEIRVMWHNLWIDAFHWFSDRWNETLGKLPGMPKISQEATDQNPLLARWKDVYDLQAAELYEKTLREKGRDVAHDLFYGGKWQDTAQTWRETLPEDRWGYKPLTEDQLDSMPGDQAFLRFGKWLQGEEKETGPGAGLPRGGLEALESRYESLYPSAPSAIVPATQSPQGERDLAAKDRPVEVVIQHAEINLDSKNAANSTFIDSLNEALNRSNSRDLKRVNHYG